MMELNRNISVVADVEPAQLKQLVQDVAGLPGVSSIKLGFEVGLGLRLANAVQIVRDIDPELYVIYDHQKGATDPHHTSRNFARAMEYADVDAAILFPFTGPATQNAYTKDLQATGIEVISGADMTHADLLSSEDGKTGGYIHPQALQRMYALACDLGVRNFVVPGTKPAQIALYRQLFDEKLGDGNYHLWAPGIGTQGGDLEVVAITAGPHFTAFVGRAIFEAPNPREAAAKLGKQILELS